MKITDEELAALRAKNTRPVVVLNVLNEAGEVVRQFAFKKIDRASYAQHRAAAKQALAMGGGTGEEEATVARQLLVWPDDNKKSFDDLREEAPAVVIALGQDLLNEADAGLAVSRDPR